jgi:hypothetical protein
MVAALLPKIQVVEVIEFAPVRWTRGVTAMAKKMSKLKAFKGRSKGQRKRRKVEAVEAAVDKAMDGVTEIVRHGIRRFPRLKKG